MANRFKLKKLFYVPSRHFFLTYLLILLNVVFLNIISSSKESLSSSELVGLGTICVRNLSETSESLVESNAKIELEKNQSVNENADSTDKDCSIESLPFGCKQSDLKKKLKKWQLRNLLFSGGFILIKKKRTYIIYYYYNQYLKKKYYLMMNKIVRNFTEEALKNGMSEEERMVHLMECYTGLTKDMEKMEKNFEKKFYTFIQKKNIWYSELESFVFRFKKLWMKEMKKCELKWTATLTNKITKS
ncbi:RAD protein [Plasmodium cynomolgi strain B]|uniref:RAD protein n=1 Tax=Plasmodium cynomolgi (strain B) TaxID=1120755 RepID=K6UT76_PLACD|nr:RAD protein [Plasmodium cynomolgi strain B]GAB65280.1 RAD protein [Plasmodium cynomolgi strain B]